MRIRQTLAATAALLLLLPCLLTAQTPAEPDTLELAKLTPEELFLRASSSALQFEPMREPSRRILVREHGDSIPYLVTELDTDGARERHALEDIFVRIGDPAVEPLIEALAAEAERTDTTRGARLAAGVLGRLGNEAAVAQLSLARSHADWKVRGAVAGALGRIGSADAVPALVSMLEDDNEVVRKSAAVGLGRVAAASEADLEESVAEALTTALGDESYAVRYSSSTALARMGESALESVTLVVEEGDGESRLMAIRAAGAMGSRKALRTLMRALRSEDWVVRAFAAQAIGSIGPDGRARRALRKAGEEPDHPLVAAAVARALESER